MTQSESKFKVGDNVVYNWGDETFRGVVHYVYSLEAFGHPMYDVIQYNGTIGQYAEDELIPNLGSLKN